MKEVETQPQILARIADALEGLLKCQEKTRVEMQERHKEIQESQKERDEQTRERDKANDEREEQYNDLMKRSQLLDELELRERLAELPEHLQQDFKDAFGGNGFFAVENEEDEFSDDDDEIPSDEIWKVGQEEPTPSGSHRFQIEDEDSEKDWGDSDFEDVDRCKVCGLTRDEHGEGI